MAALLALGMAAGLGPTGRSAVAQTQEPVRLPSLGEPDAADMTEPTERRLGDLIMRQIRRDPAVLDDPQLLAHVQALWAPLVTAARKRGEIVADTDENFAWETFLIRDRSINAFALPGGYVGVHLGLIAQSVLQDELAAVLAHELSHITQRHIVRANTQAKRQSALALGAMLLGVLAGARSGSADLAQASVMGSQAAMIQGQLNFSRDMEREADRIGFTIMTDAGYAPGGAAAMFERLDRANRLNDFGNFPYLRSHPLTIERIGEARSRAQSHEYALGHAKGAASQTVVVTGQALRDGIPPQSLHELMRARARVLMDTSEPALRHLQRAAQGQVPSEDRAHALYAAALASLHLAEHATARSHLEALAALPLDPSTRQAVDLLRAELAVGAGQARQALTLLETLDGRQRTVRLARADAALRWAQQAVEVRERAISQQALRQHGDALTTWVIEHRHDAAAWSQLALVAQFQGDSLRSVRAQAEARWALGDLNGALDRFKAGQRLARSAARPDHVEASVIDARLRLLERERRRAFAEMRGVREEDLPPVLPPNVPL